LSWALHYGILIGKQKTPLVRRVVCNHLLKLAHIRFLLADDAGAGKTIIAGLLIHELKLRGLAERILILCPANLTFQWQRKLKEKFDSRFGTRPASPGTRWPRCNTPGWRWTP
jgi:SNF2 family DNA or RNA helicase